jgi:tRNA-modifying protein YgfZ
MNSTPASASSAHFARLDQYGLIAVTGDDARAFLHAQLSNDIEHLSQDTARRAGYCSPKGRLLASFLVIPRPDGFLLQVSKDLVAPIAKRLSMYVLRSKVKVSDAGDAWSQFGVWGAQAGAKLDSAGFMVPANPLQAVESQSRILVSLGDERFLVFSGPETATTLEANFSAADAQAWTLAEVRAGLPLVTLPTQDQFVPQMANFELVGGIDFKKGCYPGQEIVARTQYLGKLKRRMYRGTIDQGDSTPSPGQDLYTDDPQPIGTIVNAAPKPEGGYEFLAVVQSSSVEQGDAIRVGSADGPRATIASLPYSL